MHWHSALHLLCHGEYANDADDFSTHDRSDCIAIHQQCCPEQHELSLYAYVLMHDHLVMICALCIKHTLRLAQLHC